MSSEASLLALGPRYNSCQQRARKPEILNIYKWLQSTMVDVIRRGNPSLNLEPNWQVMEGYLPISARNQSGAR